MRAPSELLDFSGKVVLITGGATGIGRGIAERFLAAGADVAVCSESEPENLPAAEGRTAAFVAADVRDPEQVDTLVTSITDRWGQLDAVVNNAGDALDGGTTATAPPGVSNAVIGLNLLATIHVSQRANAVMQAQPAGGAIISITSISALRPAAGTAISAAATAGVIGLTRSLAVEWGPKVRLNCVTGGHVSTETAHEGTARAGAPGLAATIPARRLGDPTDVADACLYLASPLASYVSGANLVLHGGGEWPAFIAAQAPA